jgi:23S rRNA (uracil1939-C5)-methyltransferase
MTKKSLPIVELTLDTIVGGGQTLGTLEDGRKMFVWGGLPGETVRAQMTKKKSTFAEGIVVEVLKASEQRVTPRDPDSYLSTSPWQIMTFEAEQHYKSALIEEAFELHDIVLPEPITTYSNGVQYGYRNKIEFSFWFDTDTLQLDLAFFRRGTHGKITLEHTSLASDAITETSKKILAVLRAEKIEGRALKTLLIRSNQAGETTWQLYVKDEAFAAKALIEKLDAIGLYGEIIYSNPKSPASVITKRLAATSSSVSVLSDTIYGVPFRYATEGFFQINLSVYEQALKDMQQWVVPDRQTVDMYSGVGTIGLTIGGSGVTLVEVNEHAIREMRENIAELGLDATAILAPSENALDSIVGDKTIIVDPPRAGLHEAVIERLLETKPERIIYLSCNPVTQARDVARLAEVYGIRAHQGYNFFPRTPHIEHLVVLDKK